MPKYKIQKTDILKNKKVHPEGTEIELTEKEAASLADFLILIEEKANCEQRLKGEGDKPSAETPFNESNQVKTAKSSNSKTSKSTTKKINSKTEEKATNGAEKKDETKNDGETK